MGGSNGNKKVNKKGEMSLWQAWLIIAASLLDDAIVLALIFLGLWAFHVKITWPIIVAVAAAITAFILIMHKAVVPALRRRKVTGSEGMIGMTGKVTEALRPSGTVMIKDEYWQAKSIEGNIETGDTVEVTGIHGLNLEVRKKQS
jgi:membrane-bound ClpP family serine protease